MQDFVKINENDNVAVALRPIAKGETLQVGDAQVTTLEEIPQGHKFALKAIGEGEDVINRRIRIRAMPKKQSRKASGFMSTILRQRWEICFLIHTNL